MQAVGQPQLAVQCLDDFAADGQAQAGAAVPVARGKGLEQPAFQLGADAGSAVGNAQQRIAGAMGEPHLQRRARRRVADGVVQQVAGEFAQHPLRGGHLHRLVGLQLEVQPLVRHQRGQVQRDIAHDLLPGLGRGCFGLLAQLFHLGQGQHLVGQTGGAVHRGFDFGQRLLRRHVAAPGGLHLGLEHGQRCAQLVGGIAHKTLLVGQQRAQPVHDLVGGVQQRLQLARHGGRLQGAEVALRALVDGIADAAHRPGDALHHHQHGQHHQRHQQGLAPQRVAQQVQRQCLAQLQGLGHLDHRHAASGGAGHGLQQHGHAHRLPAKGGIVEIHQRAVGRARRDAAPPHG